MAMYAISEVPCIVSGNTMFLLDPSGRYLPTSVSGGDGASPTAPSGLGRAYPLVPNDLPKRFPDQFAPLGVFGFRPSAGKPLDGTMMRLPLRSHLLAAHSALSKQFWSVGRVRDLFRALRKQSATALLGLDHIDVLSTAEWPPGSSAPTRTLQVSLGVPPQEGGGQRGALVQDASWRSTSILGLFSGGSKQRDSAMLVDITHVYREPSRPSAGDAPTSPETSTRRPSLVEPPRGPSVAAEAQRGDERQAAANAHPDRPSEVVMAVAVGPAIEGAISDGVVIDGPPLGPDGGQPGAGPDRAAAQSASAASEGPIAGAVDGKPAAAADTAEEEEAADDAYLACEEQLHTDRWLLCEVLAAGRTRALALEQRFAARGALPYAAIAVHLLHDGSLPEHQDGGCLAAPVPLPVRTGLPVHVIGRFELQPAARAVQLSAAGSHADDAMRVEWNRELFAAAALAYGNVLAALPRQRVPLESMYRYWPTESTVALDDLNAVLLAPLFAILVESPLFLAQPRELEEERVARKLCRLDDGLVLRSGMDQRIEAFVRQHFTVFDLPTPLAEHLLSTSPKGMHPFTPMALRQYLRRKLSDPKKRERRLAMSAWDAMHSAQVLSTTARPGLAPRP